MNFTNANMIELALMRSVFERHSNGIISDKMKWEITDGRQSCI